MKSLTKQQAKSPAKWLSVLALLALLAGCATFHDRPLPQRNDLVSTPTLKVPTKKLRIPGLAPHPLEPALGLDRTDVVLLAVVNNPQLRAARLKAGVARSQLIQAGMIPNPQLSSSFLYPVGGPPPVFNAYNFGLMQSIDALITRGAARTSASRHVKQVNLDILWQEWQVAQKARQLYIQARSEDRLRRLLDHQVNLDRHQYRRDQKALPQGQVTRTTAAADLSTLMAAKSQQRQLQTKRNQTWHQLDELMGLKPAARPRLLASPALTQFSAAQFHAALAELPERRPDLLALRAGYQSQQAAVRKAILGQFPKLSIGPTGGSDNSNVQSVGFNINFSLPLFNRNQGQIAIQRATRKMLHAQYQAQLDQAFSQAHQMWRATRIMSRQLKTLKRRLPTLTADARAAEQAFRRHDITAGTYTSLETQWLSRRIEAIKLSASLAKARAGLETLLGMTLDPADEKSTQEKS